MPDEEGSLAGADLYERIRRKTRIPITERDLERTLTAVPASGDLWELADRSDVPLAALPTILEECERAHLARRRGDRLELTPLGQEHLRSRGWERPWDIDCSACDGRGIDLKRDPSRDLLKRFQEIVRERPEPHCEHDQAYMTPQSTVARVALMGDRGDLAGKRIIVLGDDDLVGLAAALSGKPALVTVLEVDSRLVDFMEDVRARTGLERLEARTHDLRRPLIQADLGRYDTFVTDPPEGLQAFRLFVRRGLSALATAGGAGYFGLSRREASLSKWRRLQRWLLDQGACMTDCLDDFSEYVNWPYWEEMRIRRWLDVESPPERNWYRSALIRCELVEPKAYPNEPFEGTFEDPELGTT